MYERVANIPAPRFRDEELATLCCGGNGDAGMLLCERLEGRGIVPTVSMFVAMVSPRTQRVSVTGFDCLADAVATWRLIGERDGTP